MPPTICFTCPACRSIHGLKRVILCVFWLVYTIATMFGVSMTGILSEFSDNRGVGL